MSNLSDIFSEYNEERFKDLARQIASAISISKEEIEKKLNEYKEKKLNIAVIGDAGCGKSTLINALRGLFPTDTDAAEIDVKECTKEPKPFKFPGNEKCQLWDMPGVNTPNFPLDTYLDDIRSKEK